MHCSLKRAIQHYERTHSYRPHLWGRYVLFVSIVFLVGFRAAPLAPFNATPTLPLQRTDLRLHDVTVQVTIPWNQPIPPTGGAGTPILWPLVPTSNWSYVDTSSIRVRLENGPYVQVENNGWSLTTQSKTPGQYDIRIPIPNKLAGRLAFQVRFKATTFSSVLNEQAAARIPWVSEWPEDVAEFLKPSDFIQSDTVRFQRAVTEVVGNNLRKASPHITAKALIRHCLMNITSTGQYSDQDSQTTRGLNVKGALFAASTGRGSACDLVCACVAILRAAGIPARPVIGMTIADVVGTSTTSPRYIVWAEYALPNVGWVPFNPKRMQGTVNQTPLFDAWQGLGTMPWLNRRVPMAFTFVAGGVNQAYDAIGPWGWVPIYRNRPLPVPETQLRMPLYRSANDDIYILVQFLPSRQSLQMTFVGSPNTQ